MSYPGSYVPYKHIPYLPAHVQEQRQFLGGQSQPHPPNNPQCSWRYPAPVAFQHNPGLQPVNFDSAALVYPPRPLQPFQTLRPLLRVTFYALTPLSLPILPLYQNPIPPKEFFGMDVNSPNSVLPVRLEQGMNQALLSNSIEGANLCNGGYFDSAQSQPTQSPTPVSAQQLPDRFEIMDYKSENLTVKQSVASTSQISEGVVPIEMSKPVHQYNLGRIRDIMMAYLYEEPYEIDCLTLTDTETAILKVLLIKKLIQDKKISKLYYIIKNLDQEGLQRFMQETPPVNRKNIIKANIFKSLWKILEGHYKGQMIDLFFSHLYHQHPRESFSIRVYRKMHNSNLGDNFYRLCFLSERFCQEFKEILMDPEFGNDVIQQSKQKFIQMFESWVTGLLSDTQRNVIVLDRHTKLPDFKFGTSVYELSLATSLFEKIMKDASATRSRY